MGWCSGTEVFDIMAEALIDENPVDKKALLGRLVDILEDMDWDCQQDSRFYDHPLVREVMQGKHPSWFEEKP